LELEVEEYCDVGLYYDPGYKKDEICKNIKDAMILDVVGKLHAVG